MKGRSFAWLAAYALATPLAFPHPIGEHVLDLGLVFGWVAPACLWCGLDRLTPKAAAGRGFLAAWAAYALLFHWIYVVTVTYGHAAPVVGVIAPIALALYPAAAVGLLAAGWAWLRRRGFADPFSAAALWVVHEHLRTFALTGFPWGLLGYSQHENPWLLGLAPWTGVYGLSFALVLGGVSAAELGRAALGGRALPRGALAGVAGVAILYGLGALGRAEPVPDGVPRLRLAVLQGNIDQGVKWDRAWAERTLRVYEDLSRRAVADGAQVVVWPETAVPGLLPRDRGLLERLERLASRLGVVLVVGAVGVEEDGGSLRFFDSAFVLGPDGRLEHRYDKAHLVPFGEYLPFRELLGSFLSAVATGIAPGDVTAGSGPRALAVARPEGGSVSVGVPICYELIFPDLVRRFVRDGASVLFALTNDAWYGRTGAPYQFLAITSLRSAENRIWTARAANTGVSAFIDHRGRVRARTRIFVRDSLVMDVPLLAPPEGGSPYTRYGNVFALGAWAGVMARVAVGLRSRRRGGEG